eukprot:Amastigsp_a515007_38.p4 type:complete len:123 gc:universal Amastigsp_a515007_38:206-574(+)
MRTRHKHGARSRRRAQASARRSVARVGRPGALAPLLWKRASRQCARLPERIEPRLCAEGVPKAPTLGNRPALHPRCTMQRLVMKPFALFSRLAFCWPLIRPRECPGCQSTSCCAASRPLRGA